MISTVPTLAAIMIAVATTLRTLADFPTAWTHQGDLLTGIKIIRN